ncbi:sigma-70 family RNA polymerase sigma factor [Lysinibacillus sphaericus]
MKSTPANFIPRLKKRKEDALEYVIDAYLPLVKTIAVKVLHSMQQPDIDECVNDVFLTVWENARQFQGEAADFKKWIGMIAKYKAIDRYRQVKKRMEREEPQALLRETGGTGTEESVMKREGRNEILAAISQLKDADRDIFMMKYYLGFSNNEIADNLGISKAAVDNRLYRGKKVLATNLKLKELLI